jgi:hypothetical protein
MKTKDAIITAHRNMLAALDAMLAKAEGDARGDALLSARLADDMHPLATQIRFLCNMPGEAMARLIGIEYESSDDDPATLAIAREWIAATLDQINGWAEQEFLADDAAVELALPNAMTFDLTASQYVLEWALPQYYFHATTAYAILRKEGLPLGKADFVGYMFQYLRQPTQD